ncbi:MAG: GNAT family N-acetyltransferase [Bacteroidetes bacterium]|nr:MAG: GNAT family N-acetyltransferase [Bacteroidota bacterium]
MTRTLTIRKAKQEDLHEVFSLLQQSNLPTDGVAEHISHFLIAESKGTIAGTIGLEPYPPAALVRSAAVLPEFRNLGIGTMLFNTLVTVATENRLNELYLFTNTAESYFQRKGFAPVQREAVQGEITSSVEFKIHTCASATLMKLPL